MITKEQATAAYHAQRPNADDYQSRIVSMEQVGWIEAERKNTRRYWMTDTVDWQEQAWSIDVDYRWKSASGWTEWVRGHCYVIEPKAGPYVVK